MAVICPYCGKEAKLVDSDIVYGQNYGRLYLCTNYPKCDAYVGANKVTGKPLGTLANAELRGYRKQAHSLFDPVWKSGKMTRAKAYKKLSETLGLPADKTHIGMFDIEKCKKVISLFKRGRTMDAAFFDQAGQDFNWGDEMDHHPDHAWGFGPPHRSNPQEDFGGANKLGDWFGKGCEHQTHRFGGWQTEDGWEEDKSSPMLVICKHTLNPDDCACEGNCHDKNCPLIKRIVQISFAGNQERLYDYFTDMGDLQSGDWVVCHTMQGYGIGRVVRYIEASTRAEKWIVQRVDVEGHKAKLEKEREAKELAEMLG